MKSITAVLLCFLLVAVVSCSFSAGLGDGPYRHPLQQRFINKGHFQLTEAEFQTLMEKQWKAAQQAVATTPQFDLNGNKVSDQDATALYVAPINVTVESQPDILAAVINALPNCQYCPYKDPTGFIKCPDGMPGYCNAWMQNMCTVVVPDGHPEYVGPYEFSNCILFALGKDVRNR